MTDGRHKKKTIKVTPNDGSPSPAGTSGGADLNVAEAVDVGFDGVRAQATGGRRQPSAGPSTGAAEAPAEDAEPPPGADDPLAAALAERDDYLKHLQRLQAEFDNYRRRVQRDNEALVLRAGEGVVEALLPVIDNMQRALEAAQRHEAEQLVEGVEIVAGQLRSVLESHGLTEVPAEPGAPFDPTVHEAVLAQPHADHVEGLIVAVLERGYLLHGRLLRPSKVIVAA